MAKGNIITFECQIPDLGSQTVRFMTRDLGDDYSEYVVKPTGELWRICSDYNQKPEPVPLFTGTVETEGAHEYVARFKNGWLIGAVEKSHADDNPNHYVDEFGAIRPEYIDSVIRASKNRPLDWREISYLIGYIHELRDHIAILKDNDE